MGIKITPIHPDRGKIDLDDDAAVRHWMKTLGASRAMIALAVEKVGANPETVRKELARETASSEQDKVVPGAK